MDNREKYFRQKRFYTRLFLSIGLPVFFAGILLELAGTPLSFDARLVTSTGILLSAVGFSSWVRLLSIKGDPQKAKRVITAESDERVQFIRARAGHRGFWAALTLTYALLMWESLASNGSLSVLSDDARWAWLAAAVVLPLVIYIASIVYDQQHY